MLILKVIKEQRKLAEHKDGNTVAWLIAHANLINTLGMSQKAIANYLGVSGSIVSIALNAAEEIKKL